MWVDGKPGLHCEEKFGVVFQRRLTTKNTSNMNESSVLFFFVRIHHQTNLQFEDKFNDGFRCESTNVHNFFEFSVVL